MARCRSRSIKRFAALAALLVVTACGAEPADEPNASVRVGQARASELAGDWPARTTTSTTTTTSPTTTSPPTTSPPTTSPPTTSPLTTSPPVAAPPVTSPPVTSPPVAAPPGSPASDPATGLTVSGPMGPPWPSEFTAADAVVSTVALYQSPGVPVPNGRTMSNPTHEGVPLIMLVREEQGDWLQVQIQSRPNGATAWIKRSDVSLRKVPNHVVIELGARRATVYHGDEAIWSAPMAPGKDSSPTPIGSYYVDAHAKPTNPDGPYGLYQVSFSGFSNVYSSFGGGNGQVAMHGTNRPELIGTPASAGCVRFTNEQITEMVSLAPQGTPVDVVA